MTTIGGLVGLLPLVLAPGAGSELYRGIGAVLLGGLLISTVVTLVFVPSLLSVMIELQQLFSGKKTERSIEDDRSNKLPLQPIPITETVSDRERLSSSLAS